MYKCPGAVRGGSRIMAIPGSSTILTLLCFMSIFNFTFASPLDDSKPEMIEKVKVVIVGAGVSGIGAANKLMRNNISDILVVEAMDRLGGRVNYQTLPDGLGGVDLGGHWIHGEKGNIVYEMAQPLGLVNHSGDYSTVKFFKTDGTQVNLDMKDYFSIYDDIEEEFSKNDPDKNIAMILDLTVERLGESRGLSKSETETLKLIARRDFCILDSCSDPADVSVKSFLEYEEPPGDRLVQWKDGGMSSIIHLLTGTHAKSPWKDLGVEKKVLLNSRVSNIDWNRTEGPPVRVTTESGKIIEADHVIFTGSINVLKAKHKTLFTPSLPDDKIQVIEALGMDVVDKIYLLYKEPWWPRDTGFSYKLLQQNFSQDWGDGISQFASENHNPNVIGAWMVGEAAKLMEQETDDKVLETCFRVLNKFLGKTFNVTRPIGIIRSGWWNNEDVKGSYSYNSVAIDKLDKPRQVLATPLANSRDEPVLLMAGEATHSSKYSCVHGALETGFREAQRLIDHLTQ